MSISSQVYARSIVLGGSTEAQARGQLIWARSLFADLYEKIPHLRTGAGGRILDASDMRAFLAEVCAEIDRLTEKPECGASCVVQNGKLSLAAGEKR